MAPLSLPLLLSVLALQASSSPEPRFLESIRVVSARPSEGKVTLLAPDGARRTLAEGDPLEEEGGARLKAVTSATLVFTSRVTGGDGAAGESLIVVRFDASGKTRVREYRSVPDDVPSKPPRPDRD